ARKKISATEKHLNLLRQSHTMKLGRALITPLTLFRRIRTSSRRDKASVKSEHPSQNPPMDVIKGQSSTERQATKGVRKQPSEMTLEELRHAFKADPSSSGLYNLLNRLWFSKGDIFEGAEYCRSNSSLIASGDARLKDLASRIQSSCEVLRNGVPLPHRGRDPIYIPQRNRVLYCVHSTPVYSSNGYSIRTEGIAEGLSENGLDVTVAARAGYPWDDGHRLPEQRIERRHRGILYVHNPAK